MKNETVGTACPAVQIRTLLKACKVPAIRAIKRAGMAASTPFRWEKEGKTPRPGQVDRLSLAIFEIADGADTLPPEYRDDFLKLSENNSAALPSGGESCPRKILKRIQSDIRELDSVLAHQSPAP